MKNIFNILIVLTVITLGITACGKKSEKIDIPEVTKLLTQGLSELDYVDYEESTSKESKSLKITIAYKNEVMLVGNITAIRNIVESNLKEIYSEIDLTIIQDEPTFTSVNYIYSNNKWNNDIN